jgi:hypothetical protein
MSVYIKLYAVLIIHCIDCSVEESLFTVLYDFGRAWGEDMKTPAMRSLGT